MKDTTSNGSVKDSVSSYTWSVILPTYRREDTLPSCLDHIAQARHERDDIEIIILDNGVPESSRAIVEKSEIHSHLTYIENPPGSGLGYSLKKGAELAKGNLILEINDDAILPNQFFKELENIFESDPKIGVVGVRATEEGYLQTEEQVGTIDEHSGVITGNFASETKDPIDVEHIYGFCFAYRRELLAKGANHDQALLSKNYSSGTRIETDQCLSAIEAGYRVIYAGNIAVLHLAKPRIDLDERSEKWRLNHIRNTLYLFLKHFGLLNRKALALRYAILHDVGVRSFLKCPSRKNLRYLITGFSAKVSAFYHWLIHLSRFRNSSSKMRCSN